MLEINSIEFELFWNSLTKEQELELFTIIKQVYEKDSD